MFRPGNPLPRHAEKHGQPRPETDETTRMPSAAERARTLVEGTASGLLLIPGLGPVDPYLMVPEERTVTAEGDVFLLYRSDTPIARAAAPAEDDELTAVLEVTDVAPVSVPHRIRGRARVAGWLTPVCGLAAPGWQRLRLEVGEVTVDDLWGTGSVEPDEFGAAVPDPIAPHETELLQHLASGHAEQVGWLRALTDGRCQDADTRPAAGAVPLALDRFGLRVRFSGGAGLFDARFEFPEPVTSHQDLPRAMRALFELAREAAHQS
jgi:hypothetical protein